MIWLLLAAVAAGPPVTDHDDWQIAAHEALVEGLDALLACRPRLPEHLVPAWVHVTVAMTADGAATQVTLDPQHRPHGPRMLRCLERELRAITLPPPGVERALVRTLFFEDGFAAEGRPGLQRVRMPLLFDGAPESSIDLDLSGIRDAPTGPIRSDSAFVLHATDVIPDLRRRLWLQRGWDQLAAAGVACPPGDVRIQVSVGADGGLGAVDVVPPTPAVAACLRDTLDLALGPAPDGRSEPFTFVLRDGGLQRSSLDPGTPIPQLSDGDLRIVDAVRARAQRGVSVCYSESLDERPGRPPQAGTLDVGVVIGSVGEVQAVHTGGPLAETSLSVCVAEVHRRLEFPAPKEGGVVVVSLTYAFRAGD